MTTFADLGVPTPLSDALARAGLTIPTAVQAAALPGALAGRDVAAQAPTGSGKTLAFGLPVLTRSRRGAPGRPATLVLVPTRELATQVVDALQPLVDRDGLRIAAMFGGVGIHPQRKRLQRGVDVLVGCPGRLEDLISQRALDLGDVDLVVLDEADRMAEVGFLPAVKRLLDATRSDRQTLLFSATLGGPVGSLVQRYQHDPERHDVSGPTERSTARHIAVALSEDDRTRWTAEAIRSTGTTIVFCRTRHRADRVARQLDRQGISAAPIHGGRSQAQRTKALDALHGGRIQALVATDVAARGIHVDDLACVVHYDAPGDAETYVHRSGRTGRAGAGGLVISLPTPAEMTRDGRLRRSPAPRDVEISVVGRDELGSSTGAPSGAAPSTGGAGANRPVRSAVGSRPGTAAASVTSSGERREGVIRFFHAARGFGFIETSSTEGDYFLHHAQMRSAHREDIREGGRVSFEVGDSPKGPRALDVELV